MRSGRQPFGVARRLVGPQTEVRASSVPLRRLGWLPRRLRWVPPRQVFLDWAFWFFSFGGFWFWGFLPFEFFEFLNF